MGKKHMQMISDLEVFVEEEDKKIDASIVLAIRDMDYIKRKRKVEEMKKDLFGI